jgi:hypothetical protein
MGSFHAARKILVANFRKSACFQLTEAMAGGLSGNPGLKLKSLWSLSPRDKRTVPGSIEELSTTLKDPMFIGAFSPGLLKVISTR